MKLSLALISEVTGVKEIDKALIDSAERYCTLVLEANRKINLISRGGNERSEIERQLLISLASLPLIPEGQELRWLDIGSGGGFPSIPLALFRPHISFTLAESSAKKAFFLERTIETLGLGNVTALHERIPPDPRSRNCTDDQGYDWLSVKAVTGWEETLQWGTAFLTPGGRLLTYKPLSPNADETLAIRDNGFELIHIVEVKKHVPSTGLRILVLRTHEGTN